MVGDTVFIQTVTHYYLGVILAESDNWVKLGHASWIPDTGRFHQFINNGEIGECEPFPEGLAVEVNKHAIVMMCEWKHPLPHLQK